MCELDLMLREGAELTWTLDYYGSFHVLNGAWMPRDMDPCSFLIYHLTMPGRQDVYFRDL
jgi:hypothetical protein